MNKYPAWGNLIREAEPLTRESMRAYFDKVKSERAMVVPKIWPVSLERYNEICDALDKGEVAE